MASSTEQTVEQARRKAFAADERRANPTRPLFALTPDDVLAWSSTLGLPPEITTALAAKGVDGKQLAQLTKPQLREGALTDGARMKLGHVHKLLQAIQTLATEGWSSVQPMDELADSVDGAKAVDTHPQEALLSEIAGVDETGAGDSKFGQHLSHWATDARVDAEEGPPVEAPAPPVAELSHAEADASRSVRLTKLANAQPTPTRTPCAEPEPEQPALEPAQEPSSGSTRYSLDYSRFELDDSDSDSDDETRQTTAGPKSVHGLEQAATASLAITWADAEAALLKARPLRPLTEPHVSLGAVPPPIAAQIIVDTLKLRGACVCDAGADPLLLQASLREALGCMQAGLLHSSTSGTEAAVAEGASNMSVMTISAPSASEAAARNPVLLELEEKVEALGMGASALGCKDPEHYFALIGHFFLFAFMTRLTGPGISDLLREQTGITLRSRSTGVLAVVEKGGALPLRLTNISESRDPRRLVSCAPLAPTTSVSCFRPLRYETFLCRVVGQCR
eukprot:COSAG02_NODE_7574_length_2955_cov_12.315476_3_plen_509_part_00